MMPNALKRPLAIAALLLALGWSAAVRADAVLKCGEPECKFEIKVADGEAASAVERLNTHRCKTHGKDCNKLPGLENWKPGPPDPVQRMAENEKEVSAAYDVPDKLKAKVDARTDELAKFKVGVGSFQHLYQPLPPIGDYIGSGMDYGEAVREGMLATKLFSEAQLPLASQPDGAWDYFVSAIHVGSHAMGGLRFAVNYRRKQTLVEETTVALPASWDRPSGYNPIFGAPKDDPRSAAMRRFGEFLAYRVAGHMLKLVKVAEEE